MNPEQSSGTPAQMQAQVESTTVNPVQKNAAEEGFAGFGERSHFNASMMLVWMVAIFSIIATLFFWWMNKNQADTLADKKSERDSLVSQLSTPSSKEIETKAQEFKSSVTELKKAYAEKYSYSEFLSGLNKKLTKDIKLNSLAVTADSKLNLTGTTKTYRSVADLMMALKSWDSLDQVELVSAANSTTGSVTEMVFAITAKINKDKQTSVEGGANATVQ